MRSFRAGLRPAPTVAVATLAVALLTAPAMASAGAEAGIDGWEELLQYAKCAFSVAAATAVAGGFGLAAAIVSCIYDELFD